MADRKTRAAGGQGAATGKRSWLSVTLWGVAGLLCLSVLLVAGALIFLSTDSGRATLVGAIENAASSPDSQLEIGSLNGSLFGSFTLRDVAISDSEGIWLRLDQASLAWSPGALLGGELRIERLAAGRLEVFRAPLTPGPAEEETEETAAPGSLDPLPVDVVFEELRLDELVLGAPLLGAEARLSLAGELSATRPEGISTQLDIQRTDGTDGRIELAALYRPGDSFLRLSLQAAEPAGGLIARLAGIPDLPPVSVSLQGEGPVGTWQGKLRAEAGEAGSLETEIALASLEPLQVSLSGTARAEGFLPPELRPLAAPETGYALAFTLSGGEELDLTALRIEAPAGTLEGTGALDLASGDLSATLRLDPRTVVIAEAFGLPLSARTLSVDLTAGGTLDSPEATVNLTGTGIDYQEARLEKLTSEITLVGEDGESWRVEGSGRFEGLEAAQLAGAESVTEAIDWSLQAEADAAFQRISNLDLALYGGGIELSAEGGIDLAALTGDATLDFRIADLSVFSGLAGAPLAGALDGEALLASDGSGGATATLGATLRNFDSSGLDLSETLGEEIHLFAEAESTAAGAVTLHSLELDGAGLSLAAQGQADPAEDSLAATYSLEAQDLSRFSALAGTELAGSGRIEGAASGSLSAPQVTARIEAADLAVAGQNFPEITADIAAENLAEAPVGTIDFQARTPYGPLSGRAAAALAGEQLEVSELVLETPKGESLRATLTLPLAGGPLSGELRGRFPNLALVSALTGTPLQGSGEIALDLAVSEGRQTAKLTGGFRDLVLPQEGGAALRVQALDLDATAREGAGDYNLDAAADLRGLEAGEVALETARLTVEGPLSDLTLTAEGAGILRGATEEALAFSTAGRIAAGEALSGNVERLQATLGERRVALNAPVAFTTSDSGFSVSALDLSLGAGRLTGAAEVAGKTVDVELQLIKLPLAFLKPVIQGPDLQGTLSAQVVLQGPASAPEGNFSVDIAGLLVERRFSSELTPLAVTLNGTLGQGKLTAEGTVSGLSEGQDAMLSAELPLRLSLSPFAAELPESEPISAALQWQGEVSPLMARLPVDDHRLEGDADIDLRLAGSLAAPELRGGLVLSDATYENFVSGTLLEDLEMELTAEGDRLAIRSLSANDGEGGRLSGSGAFAVRESADSEVSASLEFSEATVIRRDDLEATVSGDFAVEGDLSRLELTGDLTGDKIEVRLVDRLPPSVAELEVTEINTGENVEEAQKKEEEDEDAQVSTPMEIALDLQVNLPRRVFIRGRGLDSEWEGEFDISGTAENPSVRGQLRPVRGNFSFAGKTFELQDGSVTLPGGSDLNPELDLTAVYSASNIEARVHVFGSAKNPEFELSSTPPLPQEEIVSRILFERGTAQLTAAEAFQLSTTLASLSGEGGPGIIDQARQSLGLDVLSFGAGEEGSLGEVEAGKYIADGVFVGVRQGATPQSTSAVVEVEVTPNITLESENKSTGDTSVGVRWQWDY